MPVAAVDKVDLVFRAFADRTRLRILNLLRDREEICVCDLMRVLSVPQAKVSRHLAYLRKAGLVAGRKDQQWMHYRLLPAKGKFHAKLLDCLACCMREVPGLMDDRRRLGAGAAGDERCCEPQPRVNA
jgi:ArsR family transcriptional regulator, arsenate/arsenite/antimonite-responsive transcriptional repressor